ncbi:DUF2358 domain-containing protein [Leptolyngbya sp. AN03gr2]|uniref:DUF2358 domain-containing protein n=1 Tax=unclassified Leptolyngbya TaxID=2650499 RepID=UPI003D3167BC
MNLVEALREDYARFPKNQSYDLYAADVFFQDPMNRFRGVDRYRGMIKFIETGFLNVQMDLHSIEQIGDQIQTRWTLSWNAPLPWKPRMAISGRSELTVNSEGLISSHIDYWDCSRLDVVKQIFNSSQG